MQTKTQEDLVNVGEVVTDNKILQEQGEIKKNCCPFEETNMAQKFINIVTDTRNPKLLGGDNSHTLNLVKEMDKKLNIL